MGNETKPGDPKPADPKAGDPKSGSKDKQKKGSLLDNILQFLNNPEFEAGLTDIKDKLSDQGLSQTEKEKLVADLQARDKVREAEVQELRKKLEANQASIKNNQAELKKSQDVAAKLQKEIDDIAARRKGNKEAIAKALGDAKTAHDDAAKLEEELKKLRGEN